MPNARIRASFLAVALLVNLVLASTLNVRGAYACSCALIPIKDDIRHSDAVFSGEVQSIERDTSMANGGAPPGVVTLEVRDSWKGISSETVSIRGQGNGMNCYTEFEENESYLVYASRKGEGEEAPLNNNACSATKPLADAKSDLRVLGPPMGDLPDTGGMSPMLLGGATAIVALVLAGGLVTLRVGRGR